jgi:hypothetical protein
VYLLLSAHAARVETPTVDEFAHVPAGCAYWKYGRLDLYSKNPPRLRYWMALPLLVIGCYGVTAAATHPSYRWGIPMW